MENNTFNKLFQLNLNRQNYIIMQNNSIKIIKKSITQVSDKKFRSLRLNIKSLKINLKQYGKTQQQCRTFVKSLTKNQKIKQFYKKEIHKFTQVCKQLEQTLQQKRKSIAMNQQGRWNDPKPKPVDELQVQLMHDQYDIDNQVIREREEDIQRIDREAQMLNKLVGELALEAHKADEISDLVDSNQQTTKENLKSANKKWLIIALLIIILVGGLVTILVLKFN